MKKNNLIDDLMLEKPKFVFRELPIYSIFIFLGPLLIIFSLIITMLFLYVNWFFKILLFLALLYLFRYIYIRSTLKVEFYEKRLNVYYLSGKKIEIPINQISKIEELGAGLSIGSFKSFTIIFKNKSYKPISIYCPKSYETSWKSYLALNNLKLVVK